MLTVLLCLDGVMLKPLRSGHKLVVPKVSCSRVSEFPPGYAAYVGVAAGSPTQNIQRIDEMARLAKPCPRVPAVTLESSEIL